MKLAQRVDEWVKAGVVDNATAARIIAHEQTRGGLSFVNGLLGIGALAIFLGIAAIIGVNWDRISPAIKIGFHFIANAGLAAVLYTLVKRGKSGTVIDLLAGGLAGLTLTFIALVGQIYQSQEPTWKALAFWLVLVSPYLLVLMRTRWLINLWILSFVTTYAMMMVQILDHAHVKPLLTILSGTLFPFVLMAIGQFVPLRRWREAIMTQVSYTGFFIMALGTTLAQILWRDVISWPDRDSTVLAEAMFITMGAAVALTVARKAKYLVPQEPIVDLLLPVSVLVAFTPLFIPHHDWAVVGAGVMIAYWALCGWAGMQAGYRRALDFAISLIALRLVIVYVEVFGSLLTTGIGLIVSGVMLIALVIGTRKLIARLKITQPGGK